jgi:hypothetical protein
MSLWGNKDYPSGNQKPLFANTTLTTSKSTINNGVANTDKFYGAVAGVSVTEQQRANNVGGPIPQHAGWVSVKVGTGPITGVTITDGGDVTANGFIILKDNSVLGKGANANIAYTVSNTDNVVSVTIINGGDGWSNAAAIGYAVTDSSNVTQPTLTFTLGGRAGRIKTETLVAMRSITLDDPSDNVFFSGI